MKNGLTALTAQETKVYEDFVAMFDKVSANPDYLHVTPVDYQGYTGYMVTGIDSSNKPLYFNLWQRGIINALPITIIRALGKAAN